MIEKNNVTSHGNEVLWHYSEYVPLLSTGPTTSEPGKIPDELKP